MPRKLTSKQEAYKNNRIKGRGISESYKLAYDAENMSPASIGVASNKLENHPIISLKIKQGREESTERALVTTADIVRGLLIEAQCNGEGSSQSARVAAWKVLTDFAGGFDANRFKVDMNAEVTFNMDFGGDDES